MARVAEKIIQSLSSLSTSLEREENAKAFSQGSRYKVCLKDASPVFVSSTGHLPLASIEKVIRIEESGLEELVDPCHYQES